MFRKSATIFGLIFLSFAVAPPAFSQTAAEKAHLARVAWSAFQCGTYAEISGDKKEQARLFEVGLKAGREFLSAAMRGEISPEIAKSEVPIGVSMLVQGPSADFILGRVFENAMGDAFDKIVKEDNSGVPLEPAKYVHDKELQAARAKTKYLSGNCVLVK